MTGASSQSLTGVSNRLYHYRVYGLDLESDSVIAGAAPALRVGDRPVRIFLREWNAAAHSAMRTGRPVYETAGVTVCRGHNGFFHFEYEDGTEFLLEPSGRAVWARWPAPLTLEDTATYLLGPILGFVLRLQGVPCLHASGVAVHGRCLAVAGPAGVGKSTTAAALLKRGCPLVTEDVMPLDEAPCGVTVRPGYPLVRLWRDSVELLFGSENALPPITVNWEKRGLHLLERSRPFADGPLPLGAVYLLEPSPEVEIVSRAESVSAAEALLALVGNGYSRSLLDAPMRAREFEMFSRVVECVPVRRLVSGSGPEALEQLCSFLLNDFALESGELLPAAGRRA